MKNTGDELPEINCKSDKWTTLVKWVAAVTLFGVLYCHVGVSKSVFVLAVFLGGMYICKPRQ